MNETSKPVRTRMRAPERRASILDAAEQTFARLGYRTAGMADIAEAAGITQPMLYRHFGSKRELFLAVLDRAVDQIITVWRSSPDLMEMGPAYTRLAIARPDLVRLRLLALTESEDPEIRERFRSLFLAQVSLIREAAARAADAGLIDPQANLEGVTWLFTALGMLTDTCAAMGLGETQQVVDAAAGLLCRLQSPPQ